MKAFPREPRPAYWFWREVRWSLKLRRWASKPQRAPSDAPPKAKEDALWSWQHKRLTLAERFHVEVLPADAPRLCAYCDGTLEETSPGTIDHFVPEKLCPKLGVSWENLFPCCTLCNSTHKRDQWSDELLRPDRDPVERFFDFDSDTGQLRPAPELDAADKKRAEITIEIMGLNSGGRPRARWRRWRDMANAWETMDLESLTESVQYGPYRFVAERLRDAKLAR